MSKKRMIIVTSAILLIVIITLGIVKLYQTYALTSYVDTTSGATYNINVEDGTSIILAAGEHRDVFYMISNTSPGTVRYGVAYTTNSAVTVKIYSTSKEPASGLIEQYGKKYIKLRLENTSTTDQTITLSTVLGYSGDDTLLPPSGVTLVTEIYTPVLLSEYITNLYTTGTKSTVTNNSKTYNIVSSQSLMNDRLGGTTSNYNGGNIRYYGAAPNNYIYFNCTDYKSPSSSTCEVWRIIGVFNGKTKIIKNSSIGNLAWDNKDTSTGAVNNSGLNDWTTARLMKLLNPSNLYNIDSNDNNNGLSLYYNAQKGNCFAGINNATVSCDFTSTGIRNDSTRNMISTSTWYLGGWNTNAVYPDQIYNYERGTTVYTGRPTTWTGKIALAYPSDYAYAAAFGNGSTSLCTEQLSNYKATACANNNWLKTLIENANYGWLLTPSNSMPHHAWRVYSGGLGHDMGCYAATGVSPALYLDSGVLLESGDGTSSKPYQISEGTSSNLEEPISTYTITYNANGGTGAPASQTKTHNIGLTLSSTKPTRTGYTFKGWATNASGTGITYSAGGTYSDNNNIVLYAIWEENTVTINFNVNGGKLKSTNSSYSTDSSGNVTYNGNPLYTMRYTDSLISTGLPDYNNSSYLNIVKSGYTAVSGAEWKCLSGNCTKSTYDQADTTYKASDFCNLNTSSCSVTLGVNWGNEVTVYVNASNSGTLNCRSTPGGTYVRAFNHCTVITIYEDTETISNGYAWYKTKDYGCYVATLSTDAGVFEDYISAVKPNTCS